MKGTTAVEIEFLEEAIDMLRHARQKTTLVKPYLGKKWSVTLAQASPEQVVCVLSYPTLCQIVCVLSHPTLYQIDKKHRREIASIAVLTRPVLSFDDLVDFYDRLYNEPVPTFFPFPCRTLPVRETAPTDLFTFRFGQTIDRYNRQGIFDAQYEDKGEIVHFKIAKFAPTFTTFYLVSPHWIEVRYGVAATENGRPWFEPIKPVCSLVAQNCVLVKDMFAVKCDSFRVWHGSLVLNDPSTPKAPEVFRKVHELACVL